METNVRHICEIGPNKMRSMEWKQLIGKNFSWKKLVINWWRKNHQSSIHEGLRLFRILWLCLGKIFETPFPNRTMHGNEEWDGSNLLKITETLDTIDGEPMEFEWNIFPGFNTLQLSEEVRSLLHRLDETPEKIHKKNFIYVDVQRHFLWNKRQWRRMSGKCSTRIFSMQEDLEKDNCHSLVLVLRQSGTISKKTVQKESGTKIAERMLFRICWERMSNFSVLRLHCPEVNSKAKDMVKLSITLCKPTRKTIETFYFA